MKKVIPHLLGIPVVFLLIAFVIVVYAFMPLFLIFAGIKMSLGYDYVKSDKTRIFPTVEDGYICFADIEVPIFSRSK